MSATIRLSAKLPGDQEINGLDSQHDRLCRDTTPVLCLAWVKPTRVTRDAETLDEVPTVELARIEPIGTVDTVGPDIIDLAARLYEKRTGRNPLPIASLIVPAGDVSKLEESEILETAHQAEMLMGMSPAEREDAMSDGPTSLALVPDEGSDVYVYDGETYDE